MKKHLLLIVILFLSGLPMLRAGDPPASLSGTYLVGSSQPVYKKLKDVVLALTNPGNTVTGNVIFELDSDYDGTTGESFPLTLTQFNSSGNWTVTIRPRLGVPQRVTAGDPGSSLSSPLFMITGTDKLILDGRPGGTGTSIGWLLRNTRTGTNVGPVLTLQNDAQNNVFTYLQLEGQPAGGNGLVFLGAAQTTGNDNNTISYCTIRDRTDVAGKPVAGIVSMNTSTGGVAAKYNSGNIITYNNIFNYYKEGSQAYGVNLGPGTTASQVTHNNFYQTQAVTGAAANSVIYPILINETTVANTVVSDNFIGGSEPGCAGAPFTLSGASVGFRGIVFGSIAGGTGTGNVIDNNTIRNLDIATDTRLSGTFFAGIQIAVGRVDVTNNTIGNLSATGDIKLSVGGTDPFAALMINFFSNAGGSIAGNKIGGLSFSGGLVSASATTINGIKVAITPDAALTFEISDNIIGSTTVANSIQGTAAAMPLGFIGITTEISAPSTVNYRNNTIAGVTMDYSGTVNTNLAGIYHVGSCASLIDHNTISDFSMAGTAVNSSPTFEGVWVVGGTSTISNNTIARLKRTATSSMNGTLSNTSLTAGIGLSGTGSAQVYNNKIIGLASVNNLGSSGATTLVGIDAGKNATLSNNIIYLNNSNGTSGNTNNCEMTGVRISGTVTVNILHNTIYIGGNAGSSSNTAYSAAIGRSPGTTNSTCYIRNNILGNARSLGGEAHYIYYNAAASPTTNWSATATNYNFILAGSASKIARWNTTNLDTTQWKTTGGEINSSFVTVSQLAPSNFFVDFSDYEILPGARGYVMGKGVNGTNVTTDYKGVTRSTTAPTTGAYEYEPSRLSGTYLVGSSQPVFKKLTDVANVLGIPANTVTDNVIFELDSDYDGTTGETLPITFKQFTAEGGNWTVTIRPKTGVTMRTTSGTPSTGKPLIAMDGADHFILDGRPGGMGDTTGWIIRNRAAAASDSPTFYLVNDAQSNTLTWLRIEGQSINTLTGIVTLGTTTGSQGNDNNTISYCTIRDRSDIATATPGIGIYSRSTVTGVAAFNSGTVITHNSFVNIYKPALFSAGICLDLGTTDATITYNSFYQTRPILNTTTSNASVYAIAVNELAASNIDISNNYIGGSVPECGGTAYSLASTGASPNARLSGIAFIHTQGTGTGNTIANNTIRNIQVALDRSPQSDYNLFSAIEVAGGRVDVTNNTIGNTDGHDDIRLTINNAGTITIYPAIISFKAKPGGSITGNKIGAITLDGSLTTDQPNYLYGIYVYFSSPNGVVVEDNLIGSTTLADNIRVTGTGIPVSFFGIYTNLSVMTSCKNNTVAGISLGYNGTQANTIIAGISCAGTGDAVIDHNTISDISSASLRAYNSFTFQGIHSTAGAVTIRNNTIRGLRLTGTTPMAGSSTQFSNIFGMVINSMMNRTAQVYNNKMYDLTSVNDCGPSSATVITGIETRTPTVIYNNLVSLTNGNNTNNCELRGIQVGGGASKIYHNTIYMGGSNGTSSNAAISKVISRIAAESVLHIRNNLLVNGRTGGSGSHYVFHNNVSTPATNWPDTISNNNVLIAGNANSFRWNTSTYSYDEWKTTGGDANSSFYTVSQLAPSALFADATAGDLAIRTTAQTYVAGKGTTGAGITTDYGGTVRSTTTPSAGAYEYVFNAIPNLTPTALALSPASVNENAAAGSVVGTITATDPDAGDTFTYTLVTGDSSADNASFTIDGDHLKINNSPDYETRSSYSIRIRATDAGSLFIEKGFIITVADVNDNTPVITSHNGAASLSLNVAENQTAATTVTATDADGSAVLTYSIVNNEDGAYFTVNSTGALVFKIAPDFERPADPDENNMYFVTVQVSDGLFTAVQRFKVRVTNVNDNAPEFGSYSGDAAVTLKLPENTTAVGTVWAIDKEPGTTITYSIVNNQDGARFSVNPVTGVLTFVTPPDYENPTDEYASNVYIVTVQASDGELVSYQRFKVKITDVNEGAGRMSNRGASVQETIEEGETGQGIKAYPNPAIGKRFTLRIEGVEAGRYTLEIYTAAGQLAYRQQLDHTGKTVLYPIQLPAHLSRGMYVLKLAGVKTRFTERLLIE